MIVKLIYGIRCIFYIGCWNDYGKICDLGIRNKLFLKCKVIFSYLVINFENDEFILIY